MSYESELELVSTEEEATQLLCEMTMSCDKREAMFTLRRIPLIMRNPFVISASRKLFKELENSCRQSAEIS